MFATRKFNTTVFRTRSLALHRLSSTAAELSMFPEYKEAEQHLKMGQFAKALPLYHRVLEVVESFGSSSPMLLHATMKTANCLRFSGKFSAAIALLEKQAKSGSITDKVQYQQMVALNYLALGDPSAQQAADLAVKQVEALEGSEWDISLFSASYSVLGLAHILNKNIDDAEVFLQMAARWAQTPLQQLIALSNLGAVHLFLLNEDPKHDPETNVLLLREHRFRSAQYKPVEINTEKIPQQLKDAVSYWEESLRDAQKSVVHSAPSWCGPGGSDDKLGMTGLGSKVLSVENKNVPKEQSTSTAVTSGSLQTLEERLTDVHYAVAYATLLINLAEVSDAVGDNNKRDDYIASALKSLEGHSESAVSYPTLGRVLSNAASAHFNATQVVVAEGLFRSAREKLWSPYGHHDGRFLYESMVNLGSFGKMLKKWDKREAEGEREVSFAIKTIDKMRKDGVITSPFIQYPL